MTDIELVIKIDDKYLEGIKECVKSGDTNYEPWVAIANGTPLPKGHGRLIDADALNRKDVNCANVPMNFIDIAPTIIEAEVPKKRKGTPLEENDSGYNCENWIP